MKASNAGSIGLDAYKPSFLWFTQWIAFYIYPEQGLILVMACVKKQETEAVW
jgi:hypothetical protein